MYPEKQIISPVVVFLMLYFRRFYVSGPACTVWVCLFGVSVSRRSARDASVSKEKPLHTRHPQMKEL